MNRILTRRTFLKTGAAAGAGWSLLKRGQLATILGAGTAPRVLAAAADKPALLGGKPVHQGGFPSWPVFDETEEKGLQEVLHSKHWFRGNGAKVNQFEEAYAQLMGAKHCIATANGTSALFASLGALEVGPGDEVLVPPYTFVATVNVVLLNFALPIFVDSDPETFQMDANKIEAACTSRTVAMIPVHLGGNVCDMDKIMEIASRRKIAVVEDACQAHLAEWRGKKVGSIGATGCFSFQASKNLTSGEGGAVLTNDDVLAEKVAAFHNNGRGRKASGADAAVRGYRGGNLRLCEWQGGILLAQMKRLEQQAQTREQNAEFLNRELAKIPGILPAKQYSGTTRNAYHLYMFRYKADQFAGLSRAKFLQALSKEGIPCSGGYSPLNKQAFLQTALQSRAYKKIYPAKVLAEWNERTRCPANDQLCEEAVWFTQNMLLAPRKSMEDIVAAIQKIRQHVAALAKA